MVVVEATTNAWDFYDLTSPVAQRAIVTTNAAKTLTPTPTPLRHGDCRACAKRATHSPVASGIRLQCGVSNSQFDFSKCDVSAKLTSIWCEPTITHELDGTSLYHNAFVTRHLISDATVAPIVAAGRTRWKVENEGNNTLKTKRYHFEHNSGHGQHHLAAFLLTLILLAFLFHTVLNLLPVKYQQLRCALAARHTFFDDLRALTRYLVFENWERLLDFMIRELELGPPPS